MISARLLSTACAASLVVAGAALAPPLAAAETSIAQSSALEALEALGLDNNPALSWDSRDAQAGGYRFTNVRHASADGAVFTAAALEIDNPRAGANGPIFDAARFTAIRIQPEAEAPALRIEDAVITSPSPALAAALAAGLTGQGDDPLSAAMFEQPAGGIEISGLSMAVAADAEAGTPDTDLAIERIFLTDADGDGLAEMGLSDMVMMIGATPDAPGIQISLESAQASDVLLETAFNGMDSAAFDPAMMSRKAYDRLGVTNLLIEAGGVRIAMPALTSEMSVLSGGALRTTADMPRFALTVDPQADEQSAQMASGLAMLGYDDLDLAYSASYVYDPAADRLYTDGPNALTLREGGTFDLRYDMTGVSDYMRSAVDVQADAMAVETDIAASQIDEAAAMEMLSAITLGSMTASFEDAGLVERGLTLFASQSGVDLATARAQAVGMVALVSMGAGEALPPSVVAQMSQALTGFIQNGGRIEVTLQPDQPLGFTDMMTKQGRFDAEAAGLAFTHEAP